jgi:hypothetical protein
LSLRWWRSESESVPSGSGSESVRTRVRFGIRLGSVIGRTTGTLMVTCVGVILSGTSPFQVGESEIVKRLRLDWCRSSSHW